VFAWDPIDSDKYVSPEELLDAYVGRIQFSLGMDRVTNRTKDESIVIQDNVVNAKDLNNNVNNEKEDVGEKNFSVDKSKEEVSTSIVVTEIGENGRVLKYSDGVEPGKDSIHPVYLTTDYRGFRRLLHERFYFFDYFFHNISFWGRSDEVKVIYLFKDTSAANAHNAFLTIAYYFGVIPSITYFLIHIYGIVKAFRMAASDNKRCYAWFFVMSFFIISLLVNMFGHEFGVGNKFFSLFFLMVGPLSVKNSCGIEQVQCKL
jgi:hypothetical protein